LELVAWTGLTDGVVVLVILGGVALVCGVLVAAVVERSLLSV